MVVLDKEKLEILYITQKKTDKEIAEIFNVDRTWIVHLRKLYKIPSKSNFYEVVENVSNKLTSMGFEVYNYTTANKTAPVDLLLNNRIRIEVMTANTMHRGFFYFTLTTKEECNNIESSFRFQLNNGRFKKRFDLTCDFMIFCGIVEDDVHYWIIPSHELKITLQALALSIDSTKSKYNCYKDSWHLLNYSKI